MKMGVMIISKRKVSQEKEEAVMPLVTQLRKLARGQPGFYSEEIWRKVEHPDEYLVVRAWDSEEDWYKWQSSQQRIDIQEKIEALLGKKTEYNLYEIIYRAEKK
jgi:heme-degrading monooxygenase HmoA